MTTTATAQMDIARRAPDEHSKRAHRHDTFDLEYLSRVGRGMCRRAQRSRTSPGFTVATAGMSGLECKDPRAPLCSEGVK